MTNITNLIKKQTGISPTAVDNLLVHLFADKKAVYIDDINFSSDGGYDVSWCLEFTLKITNPQWMDTRFKRQSLLKYISTQNLNQWEAHKYNPQTGCVQAYTETTTDLETFLDENYKEVIQRILEEEGYKD